MAPYSLSSVILLSVWSECLISKALFLLVVLLEDQRGEDLSMPKGKPYILFYLEAVCTTNV